MTTQNGGRIKWNPGHYGASGGIAYPGDTIDKFRPELDDMLKDDWIMGYRLFITWAALDSGPVTFTTSVGGATSGTLTTAPGNGTYWMAFENGQYRSVKVTGTSATWAESLPAGSTVNAHLYYTDLLDTILSRLRTAYNKPKQLAIAVMVMTFSHGSRSPSDFGTLPKYITQNVALYGASPDNSTSGWWGPPPGSKQGAYTAAVYRPNVAAEYAKLGAALGAKYNSDPNFEAIIDQEDSAVTGPATLFPPKDPTFSGDSYASAMKSYLTTWLAAFPNTSVVVENTWLYDATGTQRFEEWMIKNRIAPGTADSVGQSYYDTGKLLSSWGLAAYAGQSVGNSGWSGPDYRNVARAMVDVEGGDIGSGSSTGIGATPLDIIKGLNQSVKASHAFWCHVPAGKAPAPKWAQVTAVLRDNPLTSTGYPPNYPQH